MNQLNQRFQNQLPIEGQTPYGTTSLWMGVLAHRRHCGEICEHLQAPVEQLHEQWRFLEAHHRLQERFEETGHPIYLHQQGCLAREATDYRLARLHFIAEHALLAADDHGALAANRYELALLARLQAQEAEALTFARQSVSHALAAGDAFALEQSRQLLAALELSSRPNRHEA